MMGTALRTDIEAPIERDFELVRDPELRARSMAHTGEMAGAVRTAERVQRGDQVAWRVGDPASPIAPPRRA